MPGIRELDARAVRASVDVVSRVRAGDLARATPCSEWTLAELLAHMTVQHYGFAAAVPDGERRLRPGAAFLPRVAPRDGSSQLDVIVSMLGRSPEWPE